MMQGQHVDPEEAVQVHQDLQAKQSVAIHWGTFALAYEVSSIQLMTDRGHVYSFFLRMEEEQLACLKNLGYTLLI